MAIARGLKSFASEGCLLVSSLPYYWLGRTDFGTSANLDRQATQNVNDTGSNGPNSFKHHESMTENPVNLGAISMFARCSVSLDPKAWSLSAEDWWAAPRVAGSDKTGATVSVAIFWSVLDHSFLVVSWTHLLVQTQAWSRSHTVKLWPHRERVCAPFHALILSAVPICWMDLDDLDPCPWQAYRTAPTIEDHLAQWLLRSMDSFPVHPLSVPVRIQSLTAAVQEGAASGWCDISTPCWKVAQDSVRETRRFSRRQDLLCAPWTLWWWLWWVRIKVAETRYVVDALVMARVALNRRECFHVCKAGCQQQIGWM